LYGLKQAPRVWHQTLTAYLFDLGCVQSQSDGALFTFSDCGGSVVYFLLYVGDIQIASEQLSRVVHFNQSLLPRFPGRDLGDGILFANVNSARPSTQASCSQTALPHL
jgi:hypothetical protein